MLGFSYEIQLSKKREALASVLTRLSKFGTILLDGIVPADPMVGYRARLKWVAGPNGALGLFAEGTHEVVDTPLCLVAHPVLLRVGDALRSLLRSHPEGEVARALSAVDLRQVDGEEAKGALVTLVLGSDIAVPRPLLDDFARRLVAIEPSVLAVGWSIRAAGSPQILGHGGGHLAGAERVLDRVGTSEVTATAGSFIQAHRGQAAFIEKKLVEHAAEIGRTTHRSPRVLELYAGSGAFGLALAKAGADVTCVEAYAPAARTIGEAAERNGLLVRWHADDAEHYVREAAADRPTFDFVVVDPPRRGLPASLRRALASLAPKELAYVSCHPQTLARDLADLARMGLAPTSVTPIDMFPQTAHVEAIAWLVPTPPRLPPVLFSDADLVAVEKSPHESTSELTQRLDASPELAGCVALTTLPTYVSGPVLFARRGVDVGVVKREMGRSLTLTSIAVLKGICLHKGSIARPVRSASAVSHTRYKRNRILSGHSLVRVEGSHEVEAALTHMAMLGHPVVGDPKRSDEPTRRYFFEKHGLDRAYFWVERLSFERSGRRTDISSSEPADLAIVRESMT